jgi:hypothetical protein
MKTDQNSQKTLRNETNATIRCIGPSHDFRTNRWRVNCECGNTFDPCTTMLSTQTFECPKCRRGYIADYNAIPPSIKLLT